MLKINKDKKLRHGNAHYYASGFNSNEGMLKLLGKHDMNVNDIVFMYFKDY